MGVKLNFINSLCVPGWRGTSLGQVGQASGVSIFWSTEKMGQFGGVKYMLLQHLNRPIFAKKWATFWTTYEKWTTPADPTAPFVAVRPGMGHFWRLSLEAASVRLPHFQKQMGQ